MAGVEGQGMSTNEHLVDDPEGLQARILELLGRKCGCESLFNADSCDRVRSSSVMLLLGRQPAENGADPEICLILNKRSKDVLQGGDLCCPGGTINSRLDATLARTLSLPGLPLARWPHWPLLLNKCPGEARLLSTLLATALRESWEEMRLNPLGIRFLGPLPSQCLIVFRRVIHPMVAWIPRQKHFTLNWEVAKIVSIPLRSLLNPANYALYLLDVPPRLGWRLPGRDHRFPCFLYSSRENREMLWGVTFRIVMSLVEMVFNFTHPDITDLPVVHGVLEECYVQGRHGNAAHRVGC
jgi:hypothetical protein